MQSSQRLVPIHSPDYCPCACFVFIANHTEAQKGRRRSCSTRSYLSSGPQVIDGIAIFGSFGHSNFRFAATTVCCPSCFQSVTCSIPMQSFTFWIAKKHLSDSIFEARHIFLESWSVAVSIQHLCWVLNCECFFIFYVGCPCELSHLPPYLC